MQVVDEEFYHIHRKNYHQNLWQIGNSLETPKDNFNYFFESMLTKPHQKVFDNFKEFGLIDYLNNHIHGFLKFNNSKGLKELKDNNPEIQGFNSHILGLLKQTFHSLAQSRGMLREIIFEDYRLKHFSDLPSRQRCFWLSDKEDLEKWWTEFNDNDNKIIFKVNVTGKLFRTDGSLIQIDISKFTEFFDLAKEYWYLQFNHQNDKIQKEVIFEGKLKILSEYSRPSEI